MTFTPFDLIMLVLGSCVATLWLVMFISWFMNRKGRKPFEKMWNDLPGSPSSQEINDLLMEQVDLLREQGDLLREEVETLSDTIMSHIGEDTADFKKMTNALTASFGVREEAMELRILNLESYLLENEPDFTLPGSDE